MKKNSAELKLVFLSALVTFFEKDFSILDASSYAEKSGSSLPAKSQEHLQLVQNKLKVASAENSVTETKTRDLAKSVS